MRGTIHLVPAEDYGWMLPLFAGRIAAGARRRLAQLGVQGSAQDRALRAAAAALAPGEPLPRSELIAAIARAGVEAVAERRVHLMMLLCAEGIACIGPNRGREGTLVERRAWLGEQRQRPTEEGLPELARRYLAAFGPAGERDFAFWSGLPLGDCRAALRRIAPELDEVELNGLRLLRSPGPLRRPARPTVRLLPAFDTCLMGYASRAHAVDPAGEKRVLPGGGVLRPTICVDGRLVGLWASRRSGRRLTVTLEPFESLDADTLAGIRSEVADIGRFERVEAALASQYSPAREEPDNQERGA